MQRNHLLALATLAFFASSNLALSRNEKSSGAADSKESTGPANLSISADDMNKFLSMDYDEFDQSDKGWRSLKRTVGNRKDHLKTAYLLDVYYRKRIDLRPSQRSIVSFHSGQNYALANASDKAIERFEKSFQERQDDWNTYVQATIAFLKRDRKTLISERAKLAKMEGQMNLSIVDSFIENFDSTYLEAYSGKKR